MTTTKKLKFPLNLKENSANTIKKTEETNNNKINEDSNSNKTVQNSDEESNLEINFNDDTANNNFTVIYKNKRSISMLMSRFFAYTC